MGEYFQNDFKQFEIQIMKVIEGYYLYKKNEQLLFVNDKTKTEEKKIIEYLNDKMENENLSEKRCESLKSLINKINEKGIYDLANLLNVCQNFFEDFYNQEKKNSFNFNLAQRISSEIIEFRNHFAHTEKISSEYILRFYENFYFYLKIVCLPEIKDVYTEYFKKDLNIYIKQALEINIQKPNSFQLSFNLDNNLDSLINEEPSKICNLNKKDIEYLYNCLIPITFPKYKYQESDIKDVQKKEEDITNDSVSIINESKLNNTNIENITNNSNLNNCSTQNESNNNCKENEDNYEEEEEEEYNKKVEKKEL